MKPIDYKWAQSLEQGALAGLDEVGRGPLAGPVVAACAQFEFSSSQEAFALLDKLQELKVSDSKKLSAKKRQKIAKSLGVDFETITPNSSFIIKHGVKMAVCEVSPNEIDRINILEASLLAMRNSFALCGDALALVDGHMDPWRKHPGPDKRVPIVGGDSKSLLIGLASVIAKEYRDQLMAKMGELYPGYGLEKHAGYPTAAHKEAIANQGVTPIHRKSFKGVREYLTA